MIYYLNYPEYPKIKVSTKSTNFLRIESPTFLRSKMAGFSPSIKFKSSSSNVVVLKTSNVR